MRDSKSRMGLRKMDQMEHEIILNIAERAAALKNGTKRLDVIMALTFVHQHTPLQLQELLETDDGNFAHDVFGILQHIDPKTTKLGGCFVPRFRKR